MKVFDSAKWILADFENEAIDRYFEYRDFFTLDKTEGTTLYISVYTQYAVYINGKFVNLGQYADYEDYKIYDELDISDYVNAGKNEIYIEQYVYGVDFFTAREQIAGLIFEVRNGDTLLLCSGEETPARVNVKYASKRELLTPQLSFNFEYNATIKSDEYKNSKIINKPKKLYHRPVKKLILQPTETGKLVKQGHFSISDRNEPLKAKRMYDAALFSLAENDFISEDLSFNIEDYENSDGAFFIFDMSGECTGYLDFKITVPEDCEILIGFGEHLDDGCVRSFIDNRSFAFRYYAAAGENEFFYPFTRLGLRYLQFMIFSKSGKIARAGIRKCYYPLVYKDIPVTDSFEKEVWKTARKTLHLCMHEHYEDCPWREQSLYVMDSRAQILCGYYAFEGFDFVKASLRLIAHSIKDDNFLQLCAPGNTLVNIPSFTAVFVRAVIEYIEYSGDNDYAFEVLPVLERIVDNFAAHIDSDGLIPHFIGMWNFYEWSNGLRQDKNMWQTVKRKDCLLNAFVADAFDCYAKIVLLTDKKDTALLYKNLSNKLKENTHNAFWREEYGAYATYIEDEKPTHALAQAMMLYCGAVPQECTEKVAEYMLSERVIPCSLSMKIYEYDALLKTDMRYYGYVIDNIKEVWSKMLDSGADTFWETEDGADDFQKAGSLCHGWSAVPIYIYSKYKNRS